MHLPDLEHQRSVEELSRLVLGVHEEAQQEAQSPDVAPQGVAVGEGSVAPQGVAVGEGAVAPQRAAAAKGAVDGDGAEGLELAMEAQSESRQPGPSSSSSAPSEAQPFVLPLGVMARNEVYPRTCKMW